MIVSSNSYEFVAVLAAKSIEFQKSDFGRFPPSHPLGRVMTMVLIDPNGHRTAKTTAYVNMKEWIGLRRLAFILFVAK
jgi:hypothetical protein